VCGVQSNAGVVAQSLAEAQAARAGFAAATTGVGQMRRNELCRQELTESLWATANGDGTSPSRPPVCEPPPGWSR
jgi:hypothetical protein